MTKYLIFWITVMLSFGTSKAQNNNINCQKILASEPLFVKNGASKDILKKDYMVLQKCGNMDSIDVMVFSTPFLGIMLTEEIQKNKVLTYNTLLSRINKIRNSEKYAELRALIYLSEKMKQKIIVENQWEEDKLILKKLGMTDDELVIFKQFIARYQNKKVTYGEAFNAFKETLEAMQKVNETKNIYKFNEFDDIDKVLETAKKKNKQVLLYFTGYAVQNSRIMEEKIFKDKRVKNILDEHYISYALYVDSREKLHESYISKFSGKVIKTKGQRAIELEKYLYNSYIQPYFVIIDKNGKILRKSGYTSNIKVFMAFLK